MMRVVLPLLLSGCLTAPTLNGARPNAPGQTTLREGVSTEGVAVQLRHGVAPDVDVGVGVFNATLMVDTRARVVRTRRLHVALQPILFVGLQDYRFGEAAAGYRGRGGFGLRLPLLTELELGRSTSLIVAPGLTIGNRFLLADRDAEFYSQDATWARVEPYVAFRFEQDISRLRVGLSLDVRRTTQYADLPSASQLGIDVQVPFAHRGRRTARQLRRQAKGK